MDEQQPLDPPAPDPTRSVDERVTVRVELDVTLDPLLARPGNQYWNVWAVGEIIGAVGALDGHWQIYPGGPNDNQSGRHYSDRTRAVAALVQGWAGPRARFW